MAPIYKLFINRYTQAYYDLPEAERDTLVSAFNDVKEKYHVNTLIACESGWDSEEWDFWGVNEYPDLDALQQLRRWQDEHKWFKYVEAKSVLGTKMR